MTPAKRPGLYANIHAKQQRAEHGSGEKMRQPGSSGAAKTAKPAKQNTAAKKVGARTQASG